MNDHAEATYQERNTGIELTPDQVEFALAMERYKRQRRRPFPTWHEVLAVVAALGYRRVPNVTE